MTTLGYRRGHFRSQLVIRTGAGYQAASGAQTHVGSFTVADVSFGWELGGESWLADTRLMLNLDSVLNRNPPFFNHVDGYANGSTLGRLTPIGLTRTF